MLASELRLLGSVTVADLNLNGVTVANIHRFFTFVPASHINLGINFKLTNCFRALTQGNRRPSSVQDTRCRSVTVPVSARTGPRYPNRTLKSSR